MILSALNADVSSPCTTEGIESLKQLEGKWEGIEPATKQIIVIDITVENNYLVFQKVNYPDTRPYGHIDTPIFEYFVFSQFGREVVDLTYFPNGCAASLLKYAGGKHNYGEFEEYRFVNNASPVLDLPYLNSFSIQISSEPKIQNRTIFEKWDLVVNGKKTSHEIVLKRTK